MLDFVEPTEGSISKVPSGVGAGINSDVGSEMDLVDDAEKHTEAGVDDGGIVEMKGEIDGAETVEDKLDDGRDAGIRQEICARDLFILTNEIIVLHGNTFDKNSSSYSIFITYSDENSADCAEDVAKAGVTPASVQE